MKAESIIAAMLQRDREYAVRVQLDAMRAAKRVKS